MRFLVRLIGFLCVAGGFATLVIDGARAIANSDWTPLSFARFLDQAWSDLPARLETSAKGLHPWLADPVLAFVLGSPAFAVLMVFGFLLMLIARARREDDGFGPA